MLLCLSMCVYMPVHLPVCMWIYIYIHTHTHACSTHTQTYTNGTQWSFWSCDLELRGYAVLGQGAASLTRCKLFPEWGRSGVPIHASFPSELEISLGFMWCLCMFMCVYECVCVHVCMWIYIYIHRQIHKHTHTHTHTHTALIVPLERYVT